jgi:hypothetical protein
MFWLSSCANIWGFDELRSVQDGGQQPPVVTAVGAGAGGSGGGGSGGSGMQGGAGGDAPGSTGGAGGRVDDSPADSGPPVDAGAVGGSGGQQDAASTAGPDASSPVVISIDFVGGGTPMAPTEAAGVLRAARWNSAAGAAGALAALVAADGTASAATVTWDAGGVWQQPSADAPGDERMMIGYLDPRTTSNVVVSGLPASLTATGYDVYVYTNGDVPAGITRAASYAIGADRQVVTQPELSPFAGTYIEAVNSGFGNYVVFRAVAGASFTLTVRPVSGTGLRAPVNGLQIVTAGAGP